VIALLDNTVLSNFTNVHRPDLVWAALGEEAATSEMAWRELQTGIRMGKLPAADWSWLKIVPLDELVIPIYELLLQTLNAGEASCLAIAIRNGYRVFTDDRDARRLAAARYIPISGTLGILVRLIDLRIIALSEADHLLGQMITAGYRSPVTFLERLL
jgi:predicted nucleic acid-binding protein